MMQEKPDQVQRCPTGGESILPQIPGAHTTSNPPSQIGVGDHVQAARDEVESGGEEGERH